MREMLMTTTALSRGRFWFLVLGAAALQRQHLREHQERIAAEAERLKSCDLMTHGVQVIGQEG